MDADHDGAVGLEEMQYLVRGVSRPASHCARRTTTRPAEVRATGAPAGLRNPFGPAVARTLVVPEQRGVKRVKKRSIALALCCSLVCSPSYATTFIGVLWPLFGPLAAPGLVELVSELQSMPDVEVVTYWHPEWSSLVDDINHQSAGTHILVIGYSLGANNSVLVANNSNFIDSIIALQPSIFAFNTPLTGKVGRIVEIYNPNPWMTFGGMGSQKLVGPNIEYITNNDSHLKAPYNSEFRDLVRSEIARLAAEPISNTTQAKIPEASDDRH